MRSQNWMGENHQPLGNITQKLAAPMAFGHKLHIYWRLSIISTQKEFPLRVTPSLLEGPIGVAQPTHVSYRGHWQMVFPERESAVSLRIKEKGHSHDFVILAVALFSPSMIHAS